MYTYVLYWIALLQLARSNEQCLSSYHHGNLPDNMYYSGCASNFFKMYEGYFQCPEIISSFGVETVNSGVSNVTLTQWRTSGNKFLLLNYVTFTVRRPGPGDVFLNRRWDVQAGDHLSISYNSIGFIKSTVYCVELKDSRFFANHNQNLRFTLLRTRTAFNTWPAVANKTQLTQACTAEELGLGYYTFERPAVSIAKSHPTRPLKTSIDQQIRSALPIKDSASPKVEMDMLMKKRQMDFLVNNGQRRRKRNVVKIGANYTGAFRIGVFARWPGVIPYRFDDSFSAADKISVEAAMEDFRTLSCLDFRPRNGEKNFIDFSQKYGCASYVGMVGGRQDISLSYGCLAGGVVQHELMHVLGFFHEHSRPDRDQYVQVQKQNIADENLVQFMKNSPDVVEAFGSKYDYRSITHYGPWYFSNNGGRTLLTSDRSFSDIIGRRDKMSFDDIKQINEAYKCSKNCVGLVTCPPQAYRAKDCNCYCANEINKDIEPIRRCRIGDNIQKEQPIGIASDIPGYSWVYSNAAPPLVTPRPALLTPIGGSKNNPVIRSITATEAPKRNCVDLIKGCDLWRAYGDCNSKNQMIRQFMRMACTKTCGTC